VAGVDATATSRGDVISIIIPTIPGRERWLEQCAQAYAETLGGGVEYEFRVEIGHPYCGSAWEAGALSARGDYLHFTADDIVPHEGWLAPALEAVEAGFLPCPRVLNTDGTIQSAGEWAAEIADWEPTYIARVPFLSRAQWDLGGWILPTHYYTDNWISERGLRLGIQTVVRRDYLFTHHFAPEGRLDQERMTIDAAIFNAAVARGSAA
jgi:hypothetical protein